MRFQISRMLFYSTGLFKHRSKIISADARLGASIMAGKLCYFVCISHTCTFYLSGLQSAQVGDQCEAIVKFPSLVEQFPFPILINAAFLKLAEVLRTG